jgi:hypothetical protein
MVAALNKFLTNYREIDSASLQRGIFYFIKLEINALSAAVLCSSDLHIILCNLTSSVCCVCGLMSSA